MTAEELLTYLSHQGIELWFDSDKLRYRGPKKSIPPNIITLLRHHKDQLRALLRSDNKSAKDLFPLSYSQKALWFLYQLNPASTAYNVAYAVKLQGVLVLPALHRALEKIAARHAGLRTRYLLQDGLPWQHVDADVAVSLTVIDAAGWMETELKERIQCECQRPFDLLTEAPARFHLYQRSATEQILFIGLHHIRLDGWAMSLLLRELAAVYRGEESGQPVHFSPPEATYADFVAWQQQLVQSPEGEAQLGYWLQELSGELPLLDLPSDRPRPPVRSDRGARLSWSLDPDLSHHLKALAVAENTTLYTVLLTAFAALLHRYTGQTDLLIGSPFHGRSAPRWNAVFGFLVNTLVLRVGIQSEQSFRTLLRQVDRKVNKALTNPDYPFPLLVEKLRPDRDPSRTPLFQVMFAYENFHGAQLLMAGFGESKQLQQESPFGLAMQPFAVNQQDGQFDLTLAIAETKGGGLVGTFSYSMDLFDAATIERLQTHWQNLLESAVAVPEQTVSRLALLTAAEQQQLIAWNDTSVVYRQDTCIHQLFEEQVTRTPDAVAVVAAEQRVTYRELNARANQLAHRLRELGVGPDVLVLLCVDRSVALVISILATLKAGGAYVPIEVDAPPERVAFVIRDASPVALLTQRTLAAPPLGVPRVYVDDVTPESSYPSTNPSTETASHHLAYALYTSGSTGRPKGVCIEHRAVSNLVLAVHRQVFDRDPLRVAWVAPAVFDGSVPQLFGALVYGHTLYVVSASAQRDAAELLRFLCTNRIEVCDCTPPLLGLLLDAGLQSATTLGLRTLLCGGEVLPGALAAALLLRQGAPELELINVYGPTECCVDVTAYRLRSGQKVNETIGVPIGRPLANTQIHILDTQLQPVPIGVAGELYIGGAGLARGYLNRPERTAQKFIPSPFVTKTDSRLYKSGDLVRYLADGNIEFLGRIDQQVKLRGYRIEPGEIESALGSHPHVRSCAVLLREDTPADKQLCAYVVLAPAATLTIAELRSYLITKLPEYMIPAALVLLSELPLTPSGKVHRRALPAPSRARGTAEYVAPRFPMEQQLSAVFAQVLNLPRVSIHDNFFSLGGHSLLAVRLATRLATLTGQPVPLATLFKYPTIAELAWQLQNNPTLLDHQTIVPLQNIGNSPPLFCIHPVGGHVLCYRDLAQAFDPPQRVYGVQATPIDHKDAAPNETLVQVASRYIAAIKTVQPHGPYQLLGWSMGGVLAFVMASQLHESGEQVAFLGLLDSYVPDALADENLTDVATLREYFLRDVAGITGVLPPDAAQLDAQYALFRHNVLLTQGYHPTSYAGATLLLRARDGAKIRDHGWAPLCTGGLDIIDVPGDHYTLLSLSHSQSLAKILALKLQR